jgi:hypothetical protein
MASASMAAALFGFGVAAVGTLDDDESLSITGSDGGGGAVVKNDGRVAVASNDAADGNFFLVATDPDTDAEFEVEGLLVASVLLAIRVFFSVRVSSLSCAVPLSSVVVEEDVSVSRLRFDDFFLCFRSFFFDFLALLLSLS